MGHSLLTAKGIPCSGEGEIGNTQTPVKFPLHPDEYMSRWFAEAPTHHCALSIGHNASLFEKVAEILGVEFVTICR